MKYLQLILGVFSLFSASLGAHASHSLRVFESLPAVPKGWSQDQRPLSSTLIKFRLAIRQSRAAEFEQHVIDISTPGHALYGNFLTRDEIKRFHQPERHVSQAVLDWLRSEEVPDTSIEDDGDWISFVIGIRQAEKMLAATFYYYYNDLFNSSIIATLQYSIPQALHEHIQMIQPTTRFGQIRPQMSFVRGGEEFEEALIPTGYNLTFCNNTVTPDCLRGLYEFENFTADPKLGNKFGVSGFLDQYAIYSDLATFLAEFAPKAKAETFSVVKINGGVNIQNSTTDSGEANLDIQYAVALSHGTPTAFYSTGGRGILVPDLDQPDVSMNQNEPYLDQLHYLLGLNDSQLPTVLSTSYGEDEQSIPASYTNATCALFAKLGARGVSIIFSSGDTGVGSACQTNDGKNTTRFLPVFPASCPFVTSVGGTGRVDPERAAHYSSGGFSDRFPRPAYQDVAVSAYLKRLGTQWQGLYNPKGRGFPDVAAQSYNFAVVDKGIIKKYYGTSCAAPAFAAIISNLNSIRMGSGLKPLGFLNPWIYGHGHEALTDIVDGGSRGCDGFDQYSGLETPIVPGASWNATPGWDPVTGWGTPNFPKMVKNMMMYDKPST